MKLPKVLLGVCTYEGKDYIWKPFKEHLEKLSYPNLDVMIVDNSKGNSYVRKLKRESNFIVKHTPRAVNSRVSHANSLNCIRDYFLESDYDYLLLVESDLLLPSNTVERLVASGKEVIGSMYYIGHPNDPKREPTACLFRTKDGKTERMGREEGWEMFGSGVRPIHGCGIGCTLVSRSVVNQFRFWYHLGHPPKHSDVLFFSDLHNAGITAYVDTNVIVPHYPSDWDDVKDI